jgi:hypothetical protein
MNSLAAVEKHLYRLSQDKVETILEIRNLVEKECPDAVERLDRQGISYYDAARGGPVKAGICQVGYRDGILTLGFIHGAFLPDPCHLLSGKTLAKRQMVLPPFDQIDWQAVTDLIKASAAFDPMTLTQNQRSERGLQ